MRKGAVKCIQWIPDSADARRKMFKEIPSEKLMYYPGFPGRKLKIVTKEATEADPVNDIEAEPRRTELVKPHMYVVIDRRGKIEACTQAELDEYYPLDEEFLAKVEAEKKQEEEKAKKLEADMAELEELRKEKAAREASETADQGTGEAKSEDQGNKGRGSRRGK